LSERHELPTAARFCGLAAIYDRYRPRYPAAAIAAILEGLPIRPTIVDVGAGTGISTRALTSAGAHAIAIEPNEEMRALALELGVDARPGTAVATGLSDRCTEAVTAFQAFHWFAGPEALAEFRRILRPAGRVALVWNERDTRDPFTQEYAALERRYCDSGGSAAIDFPDDRAATLLAASGFGNLRRFSFPNGQRMQLDDVIGRMQSTSYSPKPGAARDAFAAELHRAHARHSLPDGSVTFAYRTDVTLAELEPV
jgi:SAM-dependent methyltransferase